MEEKETYPELVVAYGSVRVEDEFVGRERLRLLQLGGEKEAHGAEELEAGFSNGVDAQKAVHVVDGQPVDVRLTLLLFADLFRKEKVLRNG